MKIIDIRKKIKNSFLYKRFAYNSEGFIGLMKFLERENLIDDFCKECNFKQSPLVKALELDKKNITLGSFFEWDRYSDKTIQSMKGFRFWYWSIFFIKNFKEIENRLL